jgi:hypothetical protein
MLMIGQMLDPRTKPDRGRKVSDHFGRKRKKEIITKGCVPPGRPAHVYVGISPTGRVKVGMSTEAERRVSHQGLKVYFLMPVRSDVAKELETETLQILGHEQGDGEWMRRPDAEKAVAAVKEARERLQRRLWVDPHISEEEARKLRVRLAVDDEAARLALATPDRKNRRISITSHRKVMGSFVAANSRFG